MNDIPLVLKGCMAVITLSLILQYIVHTWPKLKGRGGGGTLHCHWCGTTSQVRGIVGDPKIFVVVIPLLVDVANIKEINLACITRASVLCFSIVKHDKKANLYNISPCQASKLLNWFVLV